jgi:hypothetical protein
MYMGVENSANDNMILFGFLIMKVDFCINNKVYLIHQHNNEKHS